MDGRQTLGRRRQQRFPEPVELFASQEPLVLLDTNILVRYLTQDDPVQAARATRLMEEELSENEPGCIGLVALAETTWVLQRVYRASAVEIRDTVADLLGAR